MNIYSLVINMKGRETIGDHWSSKTTSSDGAIFIYSIVSTI